VVLLDMVVPSPDVRENPFVPPDGYREAQKIGRTAGIAPKNY